MRALLLHIGLVLVVVGLVSCRPKGVLSSKEMAGLLFDIHLVDAVTDGSFGTLPTTWTGSLPADYFKDLAYQQVLKKHGVSESDFYTSVAFYSKNLRLYTRVYSDVDKLYRAYIDGIEGWAFHEQTTQSVLEALGKDSVRMKTLFERWHVQPDTMTRLPASYRPDAVPRWLDYQSARWLRPSLTETHTFLVVDTVWLVKPEALAADSVPQVAVADTGNHETWALKLLHGEVDPSTAPATASPQPATVSPQPASTPQADKPLPRPGNLAKPRLSRRSPTSPTP